MPALITDKFSHVSLPNVRAEATTLSAQKLPGATSISVVSLTGWNTAEVVHFQIYKTVLDSNNKPQVVSGSQSDWKGIVTGTTITQIALEGGSDDTYPAGSVVITLPSFGWANNLIDGLLVSNTVNGVLKDGIVGSSNIIAGSVTPDKRSGGLKTFGGSSVSNGLVTHITTDFLPKLIEMSGVFLQNASTDTNSTMASGLYDVAANTNYVLATASRDTRGGAAYMYTNKILSVAAITASSSGATQAAATISNVSATGFDINWTTVTGTQPIGYFGKATA